MSLIVEPAPEYDFENERGYREDTRRRLDKTWKRNAHVVIPNGYHLGFQAANGTEYIFSVDEDGNLAFGAAAETPVSVASVEMVVAVSGDVASLQVEVVAARQGEPNLSAKVTQLSTATATVDGKLTASYALTVDVNGRISQMKLLSDGTTSSVKFLTTTFQVFNGTTDEAPFEISGGVVKIKTANVGVLAAGNIGAGTIDATKISVATLSAISADLGTITAGSISLTGGSYVVRHAAAFGVSSDLVMWYGLSSVAIGAATKANSIFALATDGKVYHGGAELGSPVLLSIGAAINDLTSPYSGTITVTATGGSGSYTYLWTKEPYESGQTAVLSNTTTATVTISATLGAGQNSTGRVRVTVVDSAGSTATITQSYNFTDPS